MSKLSGLLKSLRIADEALSEIEKHVDLSRLIGVSNAQGSLAKVVRDTVHSAIADEHHPVNSTPQGSKAVKVIKGKEKNISRQLKS